MKVYASIHVGSFGISLKVFEIVKGKRVRQIDEKRRRMDLSQDILLHDKLSREHLLEIIDTLRDMKETILSYKADDFDVYAGFALQSASNAQTLIDQAALATGMQIQILDNSRQRFIVYKALCSMEHFSELVSELTVIVDAGGSGVQLTLFSDGKLLHTQHVYLGATNIWDNLRKIRQSADSREALLKMLYAEIESFADTFLGEQIPKRLIIINNPIVSIKRARLEKKEGFFSKKEYLKILKKTMKENTYYVSDEVTGEDVGDVRLSFVLLYRALIARIPADEIYVPSLSLHEGMVCEYAYEKRLMAVPRDFDEDIFSSSWAIAAHYNRYPQNLETLKRLSEQLFDAIRKRHGLSERSRLLLSVAAILHDCGKYISLANEAKCTYTIITSSEILGLSEKEREMIALICYFFKEGTGSYEECSGSLTREEYFSVVKLAAIMSLAASLDLNHMSSFDALRFRYNDRDELSVTIDTQDSLAMEKGIFSERAAAFEDVFAIRPVLRTQRIRGNNG